MHYTCNYTNRKKLLKKELKNSFLSFLNVLLKAIDLKKCFQLDETWATNNSKTFQQLYSRSAYMPKCKNMNNVIIRNFMECSKWYYKKYQFNHNYIKLEKVV